MIAVSDDQAKNTIFKTNIDLFHFSDFFSFISKCKLDVELFILETLFAVAVLALFVCNPKFELSNFKQFRTLYHGQVRGIFEIRAKF